MPRFEVDAVTVGEGGFGKVRKGKDTELDRPIAVKTLDPIWRTADPNDKERFKKEAKVLAKLSHPNIPAIYDIIAEGDTFHIIFQYIDGKNIRGLLNEGHLSLVEVRQWFMQVASALAHAHECGIIHRDIKPENLIVTSDRRHCYVVDFGLALSINDLQRLTPNGYAVGTPGYMSPEQENGSQLDTSDDIFSLSVCLYEVLCGHRITVGNYEDLNTKDEAIPPAIDELIILGIADKPQRLNSASEFAKRLKLAFQSHAPLSSILSQGQLHEITEAIRGMTPNEFMQLPAGQRLLILQRGSDLVAATDNRLNTARSDFLTILSRLAVNVPADDYSNIIVPAIDYAYEKNIGGWVGDRRIQNSLLDAAAVVGKENHHVLVTKLNQWIMNRDMSIQEGWLYHALRQFIMRLMANTNCDDQDAAVLAKHLAEINKSHRERLPQTTD